MNIAEAIRVALQSLWANKLRSFLSTLAIVIGVAAVIAVVTFVAGIDGYVAGKIFNLGADVFIASKMSPVQLNVDKFLEAEKRKNFDMEDYQAVLEACRHCEYVGAALRNGNGHVKYAEQSISDTTVQGITPSMAPIYDTDLTAGRMSLGKPGAERRLPERRPSLPECVDAGLQCGDSLAYLSLLDQQFAVQTGRGRAP